MPDIEIHGAGLHALGKVRAAVEDADYSHEITLVYAQTSLHSVMHLHPRPIEPFLRVLYSRAFEASYGLDLIARLTKTGLSIEVVYIEQWIP